jgi:hypothetical protein
MRKTAGFEKVAEDRSRRGERDRSLPGSLEPFIDAPLAHRGDGNVGAQFRGLLPGSPVIRA